MFRNLLIILFFLASYLNLSAQINPDKIWEHTIGEIYANAREVIISPDKDYIIACSEWYLYFIDFKNGARLNKLKGGNGEIMDMKLSPSQLLLATCTDQGEIRIWDVNTWEIEAEIDVGVPLWNVEFSFDSKYIITNANANEANNIFVYEWKTGSLIVRVGKANSYVSIENRPDGRYIAGAFYNYDFHNPEYVVSIFDAATFKIEENLFTYRGDLEELTFSPDSKYLMAAGSNNIIEVWNIENQELVLEHNDTTCYGIKSAKFSPDSKYIIYSGSCAYSDLRVVHIETGQITFQYEDNGTKHNIVVSNDGKYICTTKFGKIALLNAHWPPPIIDDVSDESVKNKSFAYPNPAKNIIRITLNSKYNKTPGKVVFYNSQGIAVKEVNSPANINSGYMDINVNSLSSGIFNCVIYYDTQIQSIPVIIQR